MPAPSRSGAEFLASDAVAQLVQSAIAGIGATLSAALVYLAAPLASFAINRWWVFA